MFELIFTPQADSDLREIEDDPSKSDILKAVRKTLGFMGDQSEASLFKHT